MSENHVLELKSGSIEYSSNPELATEILEIVTHAYRLHALQFSKQEHHPESPFLNLLQEKEKEYRDITLNGLFLTTTLIFGGETKTIFSHLANVQSFEKNFWVFVPEEVVKKDEKECYESLLEYIEPPGRVKNSIREWWHNCDYLLKKYDGSVKNLFSSCNNDAHKILSVMIGGKERLKNKEGFKRFGTKLATLYLLWVDQYKLHNLENIDEIGIPIDVHLRRLFIKTGIIVPYGEIPIHNFAYDLMSPILKESIKKLTERGYEPWEVMNAMWGLSSHECQNSLHKVCPIDHYCNRVSHTEERTKVLPNRFQ